MIFERSSTAVVTYFVIQSNSVGARTFLSAASLSVRGLSNFRNALGHSGIAESEQHKSGPPCGLDRNVRAPDPAETCRAAPPEMVPVLSLPRALEKTGPGTLCVLSDNENGRTYGRALTVAAGLQAIH